jgi:hypothetical protein
MRALAARSVAANAAEVSGYLPRLRRVSETVMAANPGIVG